MEIQGERGREEGRDRETEAEGEEREEMVIKYERAHDRLCSLAYGDII
jgi:hypothetical protein